MSTVTAAPAGWYADPYGQAQQRYWDGSAWTGHTSDVPPASASAPPVPLPGWAARPLESLGARLSNRRSMLIFGGALVGVVLLAVLVVVVLAPGQRQADCDPDRPCGNPPTGSPAVSAGTVYTSPDLGFSFEYDDEVWDRIAEDGRSVRLQLTGVDAALVIGGAPAGEATAESLLQSQLDSLGERVQSLTADSDPTHKILGPRVAFRDGIGGAYTGVSDTPQGPSQPISIVTMAAGGEDMSSYLTVSTSEKDTGNKPFVFQEVDRLMNTMRYPTEVEGRGRAAERTGTLASNGPGPGPDPPRLVGRTDPEEDIDFSLLLTRRDAAIERFLSEVQDPKSPEYRRFLDAQAYGERFGLDDGSLARLKADLARGGLRVTRTFPQRTALRVRGTAAELRRVFDVELRDFVDGRGKPFHAPATDPVLPAALRGAVDAVSGLDTRRVLRPRAVPEGKPLLPDAVALAYNTKPLRDMGINGEGQTVAIMSFDTFDPADVAEFDRLTGTEGPPVEKVPVNGGESTPGENAVEVNLDIDTIRAVAPKAQILDYEAPRDGPVTDFADIIDQIVADGRADTVSLSYGYCERPGSLEKPDFQRVLQSLEAAVARGVTIYEASGDWGAYCGLSNDEGAVEVLPDFPGASPNLVTVGGTLLSLRQDGTYLEETAWEDVLARRATGGGNSLAEPRPEFQAAPGVDNPDSTGMRQIPDVAGPADSDSGMLFVNGGEVRAGGGTSQAAPFFAGAMLLVRQYVERESGRTGLGYTNPLFYELARGEDADVIFHDVTKGGDLLHNAGPGWDYATGLGTPDVFNLAKGIDALLEEQGG